MKRTEFHSFITDRTGLDRVFFQPPSSLSTTVPYIVYKYESIDSDYADNERYTDSTTYLVTLITRDPDDPVFEKLSSIRGSRLNQSYVANKVYHYVFSLRT